LPFSMERSVAGVLIREGRAFVAKRGSAGSFCGCWEFPGGKVESGESDEAAVSREFVEEFGVEARAISLLAEVVFPHRGVDRVLAAWLIELPPGARPELIEHDAVSWASAAELGGLKLVDSDRALLPWVLPLLVNIK
jgi:mutator protein MutT